MQGNQAKCSREQQKAAKKCREQQNAGKSKKRQEKKRRTGQVGGKKEVVMMVVPDKVGVSEWWKAQKQRGMVGSMAGIPQEIKKRLPERMMLGRSSTPTLGKIVKRPAQSKGAGKGDATGQE